MTIKKIKSTYSVLKENNKYHLFSKIEKGKLTPDKYVCTIIRNKWYNFAVIDYNPETKKYGKTKNFVSTFGKLKKQIKNKLESYKYNSEYYLPTYRNGFFRQLAVTEYLNKLGFINPNGDYFVLNKKSLYEKNITDLKISIHNLCSFNYEKELSIKLWLNDYSWNEVNTDGSVDEIIRGINTLVYPLLLTNISQTLNVVDLIDFNCDTIDIINKSLHNLDIVETDIKVYLKNKLQDIIDKL